MPPLVAIGLPVYNGERFLVETLASLQAQTFENFAVVVVDNASTDATEAIVRAAMRDDPRIHYARNERNLGATLNHNHAFSECLHFGAPYFRWAAYDDLLHPTYLAETLAALEAQPRAVLAFPGVRLIDEEGRALAYDEQAGGYPLPAGGFWPYRRTDTDGLLHPDPVRRYAASLGSGPAVYATHGLIRTTALAETRRYQLHGVEDVLMAELALRGPFVRLDAPLFEMRMHRRSTHYMDREEYLAYEGGEDHRSGRGSYRRAFNFLRAPFEAPLSPRDRLRAVSAWARFAVQPQQLRRLVVPGPNNYFGLDFRRLPQSTSEAEVGARTRTVHQDCL